MITDDNGIKNKHPVVEYYLEKCIGIESLMNQYRASVPKSLD